MVECECSLRGDSFEHYQVLIDTWWNVNSFMKPINQITNAVLIDTWWNVNGNRGLGWKLLEVGFNRYMVECE